MAKTDFLSRINPDVSAHLFSYLTPEDVVRCERLSKFWECCSRQWMAFFGLRWHWSDIPGSRLARSEAEAIKQYKKLARRDFSFRHGRPSIIHKVCQGNLKIAPQNCVVAGDLLVWSSTIKVYLQRLSFKDDGSTYPPERLSYFPWDVGINPVHLNEDGYMLVRHGDKHSLRHAVYSLENQRKVWQHDQKFVIYNKPPYAGLYLGKERLYCKNNLERGLVEIVAYNFKTGKLLYKKTLDIDSLFLDCGVDKLYFTRDQYSKEYMIQTKCSRFADCNGNYSFDIVIIDLARAETVHEFQYKASFNLSVTDFARPNCFFALVTYNNEIPTMDNFSQKSDGTFKTVCRDYVLLPSFSYTFAIIRCSRIAVTAKKGSPPQIGTLVEYFNEDPEMDGLKITRPDPLSHGPVDDKWFKIIDTHNLTLPSRSTTTNRPLRFQFPKKPQVDKISIVSGQRLELGMTFFVDRDDDDLPDEDVPTGRIARYVKYLCDFSYRSQGS